MTLHRTTASAIVLAWCALAGNTQASAQSTPAGAPADAGTTPVAPPAAAPSTTGDMPSTPSAPATAQAPVASQPSPNAVAAAKKDVGVAEITVTARRRAENLQSVPDSITAVTNQTIVNSGIKTVSDLAQIAPGLNFRDGSSFSGGYYDLRVRGIGQSQQGWPSVAFIVDGVPADSPDALTLASLDDVERVEVLRGPQSALYGSGAIAGAINLVTKRPTNETHVEGRAYYGNGDDRQASGSVSGALIQDKLFARISANYRDDDGRINSASNGIHLAPHNKKEVNGRLIYDPTDKLEIDLRGTYDKERNGFAYQAKIPSDAYINDYPDLFQPRRLVPGRQDRKYANFAARINYDMGFASLTSITSYTHTRQSGFADGCFDDPDNPAFPQPGGGILCLVNIIALGDAALPGQTREVYEATEDNFDTISQDLRLSSRSDSPIQWLIGASGMRRRALDALAIEQQVVGQANYNLYGNRADDKLDKWWGVYGQVSAHLGKFELTAAGRYDDQQYYNTQYTNDTKTVLVPVTGPSGGLINTQHQSARAFQPKAQISYHVNRDLMLYTTVSRGFRAGYFNTGSFGSPEHTTNYEAGIKSEWFERRLVLNVAGFHIDYSNQQLSQTLNVPPFRVPVIVPKTRINGAELDTTIRPIPELTLTGGLAYLSAVIADGTQSPKSPHWSGSAGAQFTHPIDQFWTLNAHADVSFEGPQYLYLLNTQRVNAYKMVNARVGFEHGAWGIYMVGRNLTNTEVAQQQNGHAGGGSTRYLTDPRSYGLELRFNY